MLWLITRYKTLKFKRFLFMLIKSNPQKPVNADRRAFLKWTGTTLAASTLLVQACKKNDDDNKPAVNTVKLMTGSDKNIGVLNYAYALEQLEYGFYATVVAGAAFTGTGADAFSDAQKVLLRDILAHELAHKNFFKAAIPAAARIKDNLEADFSAIDFSKKASVLAAAQTFEDLGVAAYNGAGKILTVGAYLELAGKIVSVEARHAAWIRDQITPGSFAALNTLTALGADDTKALDGAKDPAFVVGQANGFLKVGSKLDASGL